MRWTCGVLLVAMLMTVVAAADDPVRSREFRLGHRAASDAAEIVGPLLSEDGTVSLRPSTNTLVIDDRQSVLDRIESALEEFDLPPRSVGVTLSLVMGSDRARDEAGRHTPQAGISREVNGVMESLKDFTRWKSYEPVGSRSIVTSEGGKTTTVLSDDYRVELSVRNVQSEPTQDRIVVDSLKLQRVRLGADGSPVYQDLYTTGVVLRSGKLKVIGVASGPDSNRALFLTIRAEAR